MVKAIEAAALRNGRSISYLTATLEAWKRQGFKGIEKEKRTDWEWGFGDVLEQSPWESERSLDPRRD